MKKSLLFFTFLFGCILPGIVWSEETKTPVPAGEIAYYSFDNDTLECLKDSVSQLHIKPRKTMPAAAFSPGIRGMALELQPNSKGQYICRDAKLTQLAPPFTISVWIKRTEAETKNSIIVATGTDQAPRGFELTWSWRYLVFRMGIGTGKKPFVIKCPEPVLAVNAWINVAVSCDKQRASLYIDGAKVAEGQLPAGEAFVPADGLGTCFTIGHYPTPFDAYKHIGLIDEMHIFNRALSDDEIGQVMFMAQE